MSQTTMSQYGAAAVAGLLDGVGPRNVRSYAAEFRLERIFQSIKLQSR